MGISTSLLHDYYGKFNLYILMTIYDAYKDANIYLSQGFPSSLQLLASIFAHC